MLNADPLIQELRGWAGARPELADCAALDDTRSLFGELGQRLAGLIRLGPGWVFPSKISHLLDWPCFVPAAAAAFRSQNPALADEVARSVAWATLAVEALGDSRKYMAPEMELEIYRLARRAMAAEAAAAAEAEDGMAGGGTGGEAAAEAEDGMAGNMADAEPQ